MSTWESSDITDFFKSEEKEQVRSRFRSIINSFLTEYPISPKTEDISTTSGFEDFTDIEAVEDDRLLMRYLRYTNFYADIIEGYNKMLDSISTLIKRTYIDLPKKEFLIFTNPVFKPNLKHNLLYYRQHGLTYSGEIIATVQKYANGVIVPGVEATFSIGEIPIMVGSALCITVANKMTEFQRYNIGECPSDPIGYFIIDGAEYILFIQDKLRTNISTCYYEKGLFKIKMTCDNNIDRTSTVVITKSEENIYKFDVKFLSQEKTNIINNINVLQILRFLGKFVDTNNFKYSDPRMIENIILSFVMPKNRPTVRNELLTSFGNLLSINDDGRMFATFKGVHEINKYEDNPLEASRSYLESILEDLFIQYNDVPIVGTDQERVEHQRQIIIFKLYTLAMMIAKLAEVASGCRKPDDRDSWSSKRLVTAGPKMYQLFNLEWKEFIKSIRKNITSSTNLVTSQNLSDLMTTSKKNLNIKKTFDDSFKTFWGNSKYTKKQKFTDILKRESKIAPWTYIVRINTPGSRENKNIDSRKVQESQYGYIDPSDTPEGKEGCGVVKNRSITCWISTGLDDEPIKIIIGELSTGDSPKVVAFDPNSNLTVLIINGKIIAKCDGVYVKNYMINKRRAGIIKKDTMIVLETQYNILYVFTDGGRPTRPLLIVDGNGDLVIEKKKMWDAPIEQLITNGCIEYIDAFEQEYIYISPSVSDVRLRKTEQAEIESTISELETSLTEYRQTGIIKYSKIQKQQLELSKSIKEVENTINSIKKDLDINKGFLNEYLDELNQLNKVGSPGSNELRLKFIDIKYNYERVIKKINLLKSNLDKNEKKHKDLLRSQSENIIFEDYVKVQIDLNIRSLERLRNRRVYTHCEMHPGAVFGIAASVIPMSNRNPATRVGFQCNMGRQALGIYHSNYQLRFDTTAKMLANPSTPIVDAQINKLIGLDKYSYGENVIMAIMSYTQFNQEDSIIFNRASIERGLFRMLVIKTISNKIDKNSKSSSGSIEKNELTHKPFTDETKRSLYRHLGINGIARPESVLRTGDCLIGIKRTTRIGNSTQTKDASIFLDSEYDGYVLDTISINDSNGTIYIDIKIRDYRFPIQGDKFASRIAQKSTIGIILNPEDMPFIASSDGRSFTPDCILNPNAFPSRGTISHLIEMLVAKSAVITGKNINAPAFKKLDMEFLMNTLVDHGYNKWGNEIMINGMTGKQFKAEIYMGPIYYQALKHHVKDKIQARQRGKRDQLTHQPVKGRKRAGGIKSGEMERDSLVSHGAASSLTDTHCHSSSAFTAVVCKKCQSTFDITFSVRDLKFVCNMCRNDSEIVKTTVPFAVITLSSLIGIINANLNLATVKNE